jgi:signal transduction histidine kinase
MVVSGNAQILKRQLRNAKKLRAVEAIELASARGENLTRQLLAFSRRQALNPVVVNLSQRLAEFRDLLASSARGDIKLLIDIRRSVWPVAVDIHELELALINLVVNARDAMGGSGMITITAKNLRLQPDDTPDGLRGEFVALTVTDTGCGIKADILPKVFEPFFTTKQLDKGTGLGLSQVYGLTRQSGGTVTITSEVGNGTSVTIYLPRSHRQLTEVKEEYPDTAVLLTSGYAKAADPLEVGFPILRKPYQLPTLARAIRNALDTAPAPAIDLSSITLSSGPSP